MCTVVEKMPTIAKLARKLQFYFLSNFHCQEFSYVLYPFVRILKIFGFAPVKLRCGEVCRQRIEKLEWDPWAWLWNIVILIVYVVGFGFGVHHLSMATTKPVDTHREGNSHAITVLTSWMQIVTLFVIGAAAQISSWTHMDETRRLCALIFRIDKQLRLINGIQFDYKQLRKRLFIEIFIQFLIVFPLSMVNCLIIQPTFITASLITTCFWFICFTPIMLLTFKEFAFYNLMFILKSKFELINGKLSTFTYGPPRRKGPLMVRKANSVCEIPLTAVPPCSSNEEQPNVEILQRMLEIYSCVSDAIELLLRIFSSHLLCLTVVSFGVITIQSYNLFALVMHSLEMQVYQVIFIVAWVTVQVAAIGINVSVCNMTAMTMSKSVSLLHKLKACSNAPSEACHFYQILQIFSLEILQRKQNFTAGGFFDMNYKLITSIVGAATTYLVIIIQFHLTNIPDCHFHKPEGAAV